MCMKDGMDSDNAWRHPRMAGQHSHKRKEVRHRWVQEEAMAFPLLCPLLT